MFEATPYKLRSGDWGAKVQSADVGPGDRVQVTTRTGKTWTATIDRVLWKGDGVALCATSTDRAPRRARRARSGGCVECGGPLVDARHHQAMGGYCGSCAFDEFDC